MLKPYDPNVVVPQVGDVLKRKPRVSDLLVRLELVRIAMIELTDQGTLVYVESCNGIDNIKIGLWYDSALAYYDFYHPAEPEKSERPAKQEEENPTQPPLSFIEWLYQDQLAAARGRPLQATVTPSKPEYHRIVNGRVELADELDRECAQRKDEAQVFVNAAQGKDFTAYHTIRADGTYVKRQWGKTEELRYMGAAMQNALIDWNRQCM